MIKEKVPRYFIFGENWKLKMRPLVRSWADENCENLGLRSKNEASRTVKNNPMNLKFYTNLDQPSYKKINTIDWLLSKAYRFAYATQNGLETNAYFH